jgi:L-threonylcarbamoyladenylate synthase
MTMAQASARLLSATQDNIAIAADILGAGGLVAFPTETLYGLGADARNESAVMKVFRAKARPPGKPLIILVQNLREAAQYAILNDTARRLADAFWPGALTLIVRRRDSCALAPAVNPEGHTLALRAPGSAVAMRLLRAFAGPLTAPSANPTGQAPPHTARDVMRGLGHAIDAIVDGGPSPGNKSTLLELSGGAPRLLREGAISRRRIEDILGPIGNY